MPELCETIINRHPCFGASRGKFGRIHLPVAPNCNIACGYCDIKIGGTCENRPAFAKKIMSPFEAIEYIKENDIPENNLQVAGIAGPGETLFNDDAFQTLALLQEYFPQLIRCISTNGLLLPQKIEQLKQLDVNTITITINTLHEDTAQKIYRTGTTSYISELLYNQQLGAKLVVENGIILKINMVYIPGINSNEVREVAMFAQSVGANVMNIMPLIPQQIFKNIAPPTSGEIENARVLGGCFVRQLTSCAQCSADVVGIPKCMVAQ